jgi:hypothetical protein
MRSALNAVDPKAAILNLIEGKTTVAGVAEAVSQYLDPLDPTKIKKGEILGTANSLVKGNLIPMQQVYIDNMMKAEGLSQSGQKEVMRGNFGQRLMDMYGKYNIIPEDSLTDKSGEKEKEAFQGSQNSGNLFYNEINRQRSKLGLDHLSRPNQLKVEPEVDESAVPVVGPVETPQVDPYTGQVIGEGVVEVMPDTGVPQAQYEQDESFKAGVLPGPDAVQAPQAAIDMLREDPSDEARQEFNDLFGYVPEDL